MTNAEKLSNVVFGAALGVAGGAWYYGHTRGWPGIRKERKVPAELLEPEKEGQNSSISARMLHTSDDEEGNKTLVKRTGAIYSFFSNGKARVAKHTPAFMKKGKVQAAMVLSSGMVLSTLDVLTDPPMMQWKGPNPGEL